MATLARFRSGGHVDTVTGETPPKRKPGTGRPRGRPPGISQANIQPQLATMLAYVNIGLAILPPTNRDQLDDAEILLLSTAIAEEAKRNLRFAKAVQAVLRVSGEAGLATVLGMIVVRRAARHGLIAPEIDLQFGSILAASVNAPRPAPPVDTMAHVWPLDGTTPAS